MCISYGELSDAELLRIYGFVEAAAEPSGGTPMPPNPHNCITISPDDVFIACQVRCITASDLLRERMLQQQHDCGNAALPASCT